MWFHYRFLSAYLRIFAIVVPHHARERWREEWRAEILHALERATSPRATSTVYRRTLGAARDAVATRARRLATGRSDGRGPRLGMDDLRIDLRFGVRSLMRNPGFAVVAVAMLAVGIGANTAIFSVVQGALLNPLPFQDAEQLVRVWERRPSQGRERNVASWPDFVDWREQNSVFSSLAAYRGDGFNLSGSAEPARVFGARVTWDYLRLLGIEPAHGRNFTDMEDRPGGEDVVILGHALWTQRYGGDPALVGRTITVNLRPVTVIGIIPAGFSFPHSAELFAPLAMDTERASRGNHGLNVLGRLRDGTTLEAARADLDVIARRLEEEYPNTNTGHYNAIYRLRDELVGGTRAHLLLLLGAVALVLLIVCVNVASMQLARGADRQREVALRASLGASRWRLVRQLLTENVLLALIAGAVSIGVASAGARVLQPFVAERLPWIAKFGLDPSIFGFTLALSLATTVLFGVIPALQVSNFHVADALRDGSNRSGHGRRRRRTRSALVVVQFSIALVLLIGAGLLTQSFGRLLETEPGFDPTNVLTVEVALPAARYPSEADRIQFFENVESRIDVLPGVQNVGLTWFLPMVGRDAGRNFTIDGRPPPSQGDEVNSRVRVVTKDFFNAMRMQLIRGRGLEREDDAESPGVVVINQTLAQTYWADQDPLGVRIRLGSSSPWLTIVGVVNDIRHGGLGSPTVSEMYFHLPQAPIDAASLVVRTAGDPTALLGPVRSAIASLDPDQPIASANTLENIVAATVEQPKLLATLVSGFAIVAVLLAALGIHGVISYSVKQRTREFGVRMALGGRARDVVKSVVMEGARLIGMGVALGLVLSVALSRTLSGVLFEVSPYDVGTLAAASSMLVLTALFANYLPARRATRVDPVESLRAE